MLKPKNKLCGEVVFRFSWPGESNRPSSLPSITPLQQILKILIKQKLSTFKIFATVDKRQRFKSFIRQTISVRLEHSSRNAENSFVNNFKIADYFF